MGLILTGLGMLAAYVLRRLQARSYLLFFFGLANAGVEPSSIGTATWPVLGSLLAGKCIGIAVFGRFAERIGFSLPHGVGSRELVLICVIAGFGFTVALFMAGEAFSDPVHQGAARTGAMLSILSAPLALGIGRAMKIKKMR